MTVYRRKRQPQQRQERKNKFLEAKHLAEAIWAIGILDDNINVITQWRRESKIHIDIQHDSSHWVAIIYDRRVTPQDVIATGISAGIALSTAMLKVENVRAKQGLPMLLREQITICANLAAELKGIDLTPHPLKHGAEKAQAMRETAQSLYFRLTEDAKADLYAVARKIAEKKAWRKYL